MSKGRCFGISVGPGDSGLITVEAVETIKKADVIFLPSAPKEDCKAYKIIKEAMPEIDAMDLRCETFSMSRDAQIMVNRHDEIFNEVVCLLDEGLMVAFLALGEVGLYSTYLYIHDRLLKAGYESNLIAGVSSIQAIADKIGIALATGNEEVHIFPDMSKLDERLEMAGTCVFMKPKGNLKEAIAKIKDYISRLTSLSDEDGGAITPVVYGISNCGMENEIISHDLSELDRLNGYFTVIIVKNS